jgi:hypothetical protein
LGKHFINAYNRLHIGFLTADVELVKTCLRYLSFLDFAETVASDRPGKDAEIEKRIEDFKLLEYAARFWPAHLRNSDLIMEQFRDMIEPSIKWFLKPEIDGKNYTS